LGLSQSFYDRFKENGGFKRMLSRGFNCKNTYINYTPTFTAVPAFGIIKAMQMNYIYCHHTIAFKSIRRHIGNA